MDARNQSNVDPRQFHEKRHGPLRRTNKCNLVHSNRIWHVLFIGGSVAETATVKENSHAEVSHRCRSDRG